MYKFIGTCLIMLLYFSGPLQACDVCGCASSGNLLSLIPQHANNFVSMGWRFVNFNTQLPATPGEDDFHQWEIRGAFYPLPKVQVIGILPFNYRTRKEEGSPTTQLTGLGDAMLMVNYSFVKTPDTVVSPSRHFLAAGLGVKLPTGKFEQEEIQKNPTPGSFQLGTSSTDWLFHVLYAYRYNNWGVSMDLSARLNNMNAENYLFGDQLGGILSLSYTARLKTMSILPYAGVYGEYMGKDVQNRLYQPGTGGKGLFATVGGEVYKGNISIGVNWQQPFAQEYADGEMEAGSRLMTRISYLF